MATKRKKATATDSSRWYRGAEVPKAAIRRFARQVAEKFQPEKIILFGSHAYGKPHEDSDVDILVVMPARNELDQAVKIGLAVDRRFALDLIVRTPSNLTRRLEDGDLFHTHVITHGKMLYEKSHAGMDRQGRGGSARRRNHRSQSTAVS